MLPFSNPGPFNYTEKALLYAALFSVSFIVLLGVSTSATRTRKHAVTTILEVPRRSQNPWNRQNRPLQILLTSFELCPRFSGVDFRSFSYGVYMTSEGNQSV